MAYINAILEREEGVLFYGDLDYENSQNNSNLLETPIHLYRTNSLKLLYIYTHKLLPYSGFINSLYPTEGALVLSLHFTMFL